MPEFLPLCQNFQVSYSYSVHFTSGVFQPNNDLLAQAAVGDDRDLPKKVLLLFDDGVVKHHPEIVQQAKDYCHRYRQKLRLAREPLLLPGGEVVKNDPKHVDAIHQAIHEAGLCRHSYVVALGGGAVIDTAGYAAATAHRGVRLIRLPTTVMAQADASIGVKNSINAFGKKNFLGTFALPWTVINDANFLTTLSQRDWLSGVAEAVKVALIKDREFFGILEKSASALVARDLPQMSRVIHRCAALHLDHISGGGDPFETGSSRPLDFGHWAAHKLENLSRHLLRHGEAVAIGIALDVTYAYLAGMLPLSEWQRILTLLACLDLPVNCPWLVNESEILRGLQEFREHLGGVLTIIVLKGIGRPVEINTVNQKLMAVALAMLQGQDVDGILKSGIFYRNVRSARTHSTFFPVGQKIGNSPLNS
jgi:3-dehydroquinate synthase